MIFAYGLTYRDVRSFNSVEGDLLYGCIEDFPDVIYFFAELTTE